MNTRKLIISLVAAGAISVGLGQSIEPVAADTVITATLVTGQTITVTRPPGTPCSADALGPLAVPVASVSCSETTPTTNASQTPTTSTNPTQAPVSSGTPTQQTTQQTTSTTTPKTKTHRAKSHTELGAKHVENIAPPASKKQAQQHNPNGTPTTANPSFSLSIPGPAPIGVPNFFIEKFRIPPFLLPIYQAAGTQYGVPWQILAAINEIETDYGRNLNVSSAGAEGWMQFIPSSWKAYGVDANGDGHKDPYNPVDAIFAAGRYLKAAGAEKNLHDAILSYNHAEWYVQSVMLRAKLIGGLPAELIGSLTGLTQGHFPVAARATYADDLQASNALKRVAKGSNAAVPVNSSPDRHGIDIFSKKGAPVIAVQDGIIKKAGHDPKLGNYVVLQDVYGNTYTYSQLGQVAPSYPAPKPKTVSASQIRSELKLPTADPKPGEAASAGRQAPAAPSASSSTPSSTATVTKERLFAHPARAAAYAAGGQQQLVDSGKPVAGYSTFEAYFKQVLGLKGSDVVLRRLQPGAQVIAGTILGRIDKVDPKIAPHVHFTIRPAGKGSPAIDPKPILDGWKLLESTAIYRAAGKNPFFGPDARSLSIGQILLLSKEQLQQRVLADPSIQIYQCGRRDIQTGQIDRRVLATLEFLVSSGFKPTVSALKCGHSYLTKAGGVSEHSSGNAVDVAAVNGIPILGHQGPGSLTDTVVRRLLTLQGTLKPHQIITLYKYPGTDNTLALSDHNDHIHIGFYPLYGSNPKLAQQANAVLKPSQWVKLIARLGQIDNPVVPVKPSKASLPVTAADQSSSAHLGE